MKPSHFALAASLGMAITGSSVYFLTSPRSPATSPESAPSADASLIDDARADADDARPSDPAPSPAPDAARQIELVPVGDASATAPVQSRRPPVRSALPPPGTRVCAVPMPDSLFDALIRNHPLFRQYSPEELEKFRQEWLAGSTQCTCRPGRDEDLCANWCRGRGFTAGARCNLPGLCECN